MAENVLPSFMLAHTYDASKHDVYGWFWSEKLDGVRAMWIASRRILITRNHNVIHAPLWFMELMPDFDIDGELWLGRGRFQETLSVVRSKSPDERWRQIKFMAFDVPASRGTFLARLDLLKSCHAPVEQVPHQRILDVTHLDSILREVVAGGGEGIMLRNNFAEYVGDRTHNMLKVKISDDADAVVVEHAPGEGKHTGRLGALVCELVEDRSIRFNVGTGLSDAERSDPPPIGTTINVRFNGRTKARVPRFPVYGGVRV